MPQELALATGLFATLGLSLGFLYYCLRHSEKRGATPLAVMFIGITLWVFADFVHVTLVDTGGDPMTAGMLPIRLLGIEVTCIGMLFLGLGYSGREELITPSLLGLLSVKPAFIIGLSFTPYRELIYHTRAADVPLGYEILVTPLFVGHLLYLYSLVFVGLGLIATTMLRSEYGYRRQLYALFFAILTPFALSILFNLDLIPFDMTGIGFLATGILLVFATFRLRLMDAIPVAQERVLNEMEDMVIVLDDANRIIRVNRSVEELFGSAINLIGKPATSLFDQETLEELATASDQSEVWITVGDEERLLNVNSTEFSDHRGDILTQVLVCRDITDQKRHEEELRQREHDLQLVKNIQSRFLRQNLRDELEVVRTNAQLITDESSPEDLEWYETLVEKTDRILEWSDKARTIEQLVETDETLEYEVTDGLRSIVDAKRLEFPEVRFELDTHTALRIETVPQISEALDNLVDNAARYNTNDDPVVQITTTHSGSRAYVKIADNGPGIDPVEANAILSGEETALQHGSGFGLWLVYWVVEKSNGTMELQSDDEGSVVELEFNRIPSGPVTAGNDGV